MTPALLLATATLLTSAPSPAVDPSVEAGFAKRPVQRVIVSVQDPLGASAQAPGRRGAVDARDARIEARRADLAARKAKVLDGASAVLGRRLEPAYRYPAFRLFAIDVDRPALRALAAQPGVTRVFADTELEPHLDTSLPHAHVPTFHEARGRGAGTTVAILDSPVRYEGGHFGTCTQPGSVGCRLVAQLNFTDQSVQEVRSFEDRNGLNSHGTNVAAIAHGVAPDADVVGINVFKGRSNGRISASTSDVIQGLNWVAFNAASQKIVAANMSLGSDREASTACNGHAYSGPFRTLYFDHGVLTVVSSGNDATQNAVGSPACVNLAVTVAAHFDTETARYSGYDCYQDAPRDQEMACFSNLNGLVDLVAPGVFVDAGGYKLSGTSMATPHVTGAVALVQGDFLRTTGATSSGFDAHLRLMLAAGRMVHIDGRRFPRLDLAAEGAWDWAGSFAHAAQASDDNQIPAAATAREFPLDVDRELTLAGAYLYLELNHPNPEALEITLRGPDGREAQVQLPAGQANFTGVIGRQFDEQALAPFAGAAARGGWTLAVRAPEGGPTGSLMSATLVLRDGGCTPDCTDAGCGDDGCGGRCDVGHCEINQRCYADQSSPADNPCLMCDAAASQGSWGRSGRGCQIEGTCHPAGTAFDTIPCMSCRPEVSPSSWSPNDGFCVVAGSCIEAGAKRAGSPCRGCDPAQDPRAYSALEGVACDDEDACTTEDTCRAGRCEGAPVQCPAPGPCEQAATCAASSGDCVTAPKPDGTACGEGGQCMAGECRVQAVAEEDGGGCTHTAASGGSATAGWMLGLWVLARARRRR